MRKAQNLRKASVSKSTLKTRERQWLCYLKVCKKFKWNPFGCTSSQACKYVAFLSNSMRYSSVIKYYQTVIFYHNVRGSPVTNWTDPMLSQTVKGIKNLETTPEDVKDPVTEKHLIKMFSNVKVKNEFCVIIWTMIIFLFRTLLRVGHVVVSPHTLRRRDVKFFKWGPMVTVNSSKTKQKGSAHKIPLSRVKDVRLCPVFWLEKIIKIYPGVDSDLLFSKGNFPQISYSTFNKSFKGLISMSKVQGNFSTHSLRRGGTTAMRAAGVPLSYIKERGQWLSDCVFKYIKPTVSDKLKWEFFYVR